MTIVALLKHLTSMQRPCSCTQWSLRLVHTALQRSIA